MNLLDVIARENRNPDFIRGAVATVVAIGPGGRLVDLIVSGSFVGSVPAGGAYLSPAEGDVVFVLKLGSSWLAAFPLNPQVAQSPNLLPDAGFESAALGSRDAVGWTTFIQNNPGPAAIVSGGHSGTQSWRFPMLPTSIRYATTVETFEIAPGEQMRLGMWLRSNQPLGAGERVTGQAWVGTSPLSVEYDNATNVVSQVPLNVGTAWRYFEVPLTQRAGFFWMRPVIVISAFDSTVARNTQVFIDDVSFRRV